MTALPRTGPVGDADTAALGHHRGLVQIVGLLWVYAFYDELRTHVAGTAAEASRHAREVYDAERTLGLNLERGIQSTVLHLPWLVAVCNLSYSSLHLIVPPIVLVVLYRRAPEQYRHWRNVFVIMLGLAVLGFWLYPLMPPRLTSGPGHLVDTSAQYFSLTKTPLASIASVTTSSSPSMTNHTNPYAAMPSLHVGWSIWAAAALWALVRRRRAKVTLALYPALMVLAVLVTANHWVLDAAAGAALVCVSHALACAAETCGATFTSLHASPAAA
jgi:hypothetical protein